MRLSTLIIIVVVAVLLLFLFGFRLREHFFGTGSMTVSWAPSSPNPQSIAYNWGACIMGGGPQPAGLCTSQLPTPYPPGRPGPSWDYKGQTALGQTSLTLNNTNCGQCSPGQVLTFFLQSVSSVPPYPSSVWAIFTIDLSSKATVIENTIMDGTVATNPISPGSTSFTYTLMLGQAGFAQGNTAEVIVNVARVGVQLPFVYTAHVPFTSITPDGTTGTYVGSFLQRSPNAPWNTAPGALQANDVVTVTATVYNAGNSSSSGTVYFNGSVSQTATVVTPSTPTGIVWNLSV